MFSCSLKIFPSVSVNWSSEWFLSTFICVCVVCRAKSVGDISVLSVSLLPFVLPCFSSFCTFSSPSPASPPFSLSLLVVFTLFLVIFPYLWMWIRKESLWKESLLNWIHRLCFFFDTLIEQPDSRAQKLSDHFLGLFFLPKYEQTILSCFPIWLKPKI